MSEPTSVFNSAVGALKAKAWERAAELCDPASLSLFKRELLSRIQTPPSRWTVEQLLRYQPDLPPEVAEFQVANLSKRSDPLEILMDEVPSISSVELLESMTPLAVFAAWLEGQSHERQVERATGPSQMPPQAVAEAFQLETNYVVLGTVKDGDRLSHVAFRRQYVLPDDPDDPGDEFAPDLPEDERAVLKDRGTFVEFSTLRRQPDGRWAMIAGHTYLGRNNPVYTFGSTDEAEFDNA